MKKTLWQSTIPGEQWCENNILPTSFKVSYNYKCIRKPSKIKIIECRVLIVITHFWVIPQIHLFSLQNKKIE